MRCDTISVRLDLTYELGGQNGESGPFVRGWLWASAKCEGQPVSLFHSTTFAERCSAHYYLFISTTRIFARKTQQASQARLISTDYPGIEGLEHCSFCFTVGTYPPHTSSSSGSFPLIYYITHKALTLLERLQNFAAPTNFVPLTNSPISHTHTSATISTFTRPSWPNDGSRSACLPITNSQEYGDYST